MENDSSSPPSMHCPDFILASLEVFPCVFSALTLYLKNKQIGNGDACSTPLTLMRLFTVMKVHITLHIIPHITAGVASVHV